MPVFGVCAIAGVVISVIATRAAVKMGTAVKMLMGGGNGINLNYGFIPCGNEAGNIDLTL